LILDLGESVFPEPDPPVVESSTGDANFVESQQNDSFVSTDGSTSRVDENSTRRTVTTQERKPLKVPDTVHVRITPENLKEYVGPQVYHKDLMYVKPPPPGVSTGLGYLGNGSGAVMPVEASVSSVLRLLLLMCLTAFV
jgi:Lon-like ATP-dependent protease